MRKRGIPAAVAAVVNQVLEGSHATLNALFERAGATGEPPPLAHHSKWKVWLLHCNDDPEVDALTVLGKVLEEFMEVDPHSQDPRPLEELRSQRRRVEDAMRRHGLQYRTGGRVVEVAVGPASTALAAAFRTGDFESLEIEFERAIDAVAQDPGSAVTAACALLEALFRAYLETKQVPLPDKQTIKPLWAVVQKELGLDPKNHADQDVQRVLSGLGSVVDGIGAFRTHAGSAHGGGQFRYRVQARHARLMVSSAHALALFLIETWEARDATKKRGPSTATGAA